MKMEAGGSSTKTSCEGKPGRPKPATAAILLLCEAMTDFQLSRQVTDIIQNVDVAMNLYVRPFPRVAPAAVPPPLSLSRRFCDAAKWTSDCCSTNAEIIEPIYKLLLRIVANGLYSTIANYYAADAFSMLFTASGRTERTRPNLNVLVFFIRQSSRPWVGVKIKDARVYLNQETPALSPKRFAANEGVRRVEERRGVSPVEILNYRIKNNLRRLVRVILHSEPFNKLLTSVMTFKSIAGRVRSLLNLNNVDDNFFWSALLLSSCPPVRFFLRRE